MPAQPIPVTAPRASAGALVANDLVHAYGDRRVVDDLSFAVAPGRRLALVGDNGSGKSTLLRLLAGTEQPDRGQVVRPPDTAMLEQDLVTEPGDTIGDVVEAALAELRDAARQVQELSALVQRIPDDAELAREYGDALEWAQLREAWDADHRLDRVLRGLGLAHMPRSRPIEQLSGGERARVAMAALLVRQPRALLLDEPTNHLDDAAVAFLERHLRQLPGVVVMASHDRAFLDAVATELLDLDPARGGATRFGGSFSEYLEHRRRERERWERAWRDQQAELATLRATAEVEEAQVAHGRAPRDNDRNIHHFKGARVQATVARRRRNARVRIGQLERAAVPPPPVPLRFDAAFGESTDVGEPLVRLRRAAVRDRLAPVDVRLEPGSRLLVTGPNGAGKSTLLTVLAATIEPTSGTIEHREELRIGHLVQDPRSGDELTTPNRAWRAAVRELGHEPGTTLDELGLLQARDLDRPVGHLSEGQRRRLALALLVASRPQLLLLDEPTNHLSPALVSDLEAALSDSPAAVVVATHDRWLRARWSGPELRLEPERGARHVAAPG